MKGDDDTINVANKTITVTGGGAFKFADRIREKLNLGPIL
jgi:pantothenate kinase